jgi:hypothetical protein
MIDGEGEFFQCNRIVDIHAGLPNECPTAAAHRLVSLRNSLSEDSLSEGVLRRVSRTASGACDQTPELHQP